MPAPRRPGCCRAVCSTWGFAIFLVVLAGYLALRARVIQGTARPLAVDVKRGALFSAGIGFISSLLGIGGGFTQVPMLTQLLGYSVLVTTATSQYILTFMALTGTVTHVVSGEFEQGIRRRIAVGIGVLIGAQIGARLSGRIGGRLIKRALALGLVTAGLRLVLGGLI